MQLSPNFSLEVLVRSDTARRLGIDNQPSRPDLANLRRLAACLEEVRALLDAPLVISSAYRSPALNEAVGGAPGSRHRLGLAADFTCPGFGPPLAVARAIAASPIAFDQLIHEFGRWVHLGLAPAHAQTRRQLLTIRSAALGYEDGLNAIT
ncbi:MAG: peptidase M15 [Burkholderiales bacterium]|nr:peptidase M15 [Burkholderiales bacterium]